MDLSTFILKLNCCGTLIEINDEIISCSDVTQQTEMFLEELIQLISIYKINPTTRYF